jgi:hypothetical protein
MSPRDRRDSIRHGDRRHAWLDAIKADGRITFAQDESARDDSMPRSAIAVGCVDFVLSPEDIASAPPRGSQAGSLGEERPIRAPS